MIARWRIALIVAILVIVFGLVWAATAFRWDVPLWATLGVGAAAIASIALLAGRPRRTDASGELYASDPYSDMQLGRSHPTSPHHDPSPTSLIVDPPRDDLPPTRQP